MDSYITLLNLSSGVVMEPIYNAFAVASFLQFVSFSIFHMKYVLSIWKSTRKDAGEELRKALGRFYIKFCELMISLPFFSII